MEPSEPLPSEWLHIVATFLESSDIPYWVVGSMASMAYGKPRFTNDIDFVTELKQDNIPYSVVGRRLSNSEFTLSERSRES